MSYLTHLALFVLAPAAFSQSFDNAVKPLLLKFCVGCHNSQLSSGGINLGKYSSVSEVVTIKDRSLWETVVQKIEAGEMPPKGSPRPVPAQITPLAKWVETTYARLDLQTQPDPGRVTARRLNRFEYNNTVRDLLGVDLNASEDFPIDPYGYGFDNIGDVLSLSPVLAEKYLRAAEHVANIAIPPAEPLKPNMSRYVAERIGQAKQLRITTFHEFPVDGEYTLRSAWFQGLKVGSLLEGKLYLDGIEISRHPLKVFTEMDRGFQKSGVAVTAGRHRIDAEISYLEKFKDPPYLEYIQVYGPDRQRPLVESGAYRKLFLCGHAPGVHNQTCARRILGPLVRRAYRRSATEQDLQPLLAMVVNVERRGDTLESGVRLALQAIVMNPNFLFRIERDSRANGTVHRISDLELASRLSYFLWSTMPDDELLTLAEAGRLHNIETLRAQTRRMLLDARAKALATNFAAQWLQFRNLDVLKPDPIKFPEYNYALSRAMRTETEMFFDAVRREDRSILDFVDGKFSYLNDQLAKHYGIAGIAGSEFRRVALDSAERGGVLTHGSVLTVSSYPTRTSPVIRGKWVLENLLDTPPPPAPADVPPLDESAVGATGSMRAQMEKHRATPVCAGCHARMDPIGFGLENYDAIGRWRTNDGAFPIDATGVLPSGQQFAGASELKGILRQNSQIFTRALSGKLLTYALGRGLESYDRQALGMITSRVTQKGHKFSELVLAIVESVPFQQRRSIDQVETDRVDAKVTK